VVSSSSAAGKLLTSLHLFHPAVTQCGATVLGQWPKGVVAQLSLIKYNNNSYKYDNNEIKVIIIIKPTFKFSFKFFSFVGIMFTKGKIVIRMVWRMLFLLVVNLAEFLVLGPF